MARRRQLAGRAIARNTAFTLGAIAFGIVLAAYGQDILLVIAVTLMLISCYRSGYVDAISTTVRQLKHSHEVDVLAVAAHDCDREDTLVG